MRSGALSLLLVLLVAGGAVAPAAGFATGFCAPAPRSALHDRSSRTSNTRGSGRGLWRPSPGEGAPTLAAAKGFASSPASGGGSGGSSSGSSGSNTVEKAAPPAGDSLAPPPQPLTLLGVGEAKQELFKLIMKMSQAGKGSPSHGEDRERVGYLIRCLELGFEPIHTLDFLNLAIAGKWHFLFSTTRMGASDARLRVMDFVQNIVPCDEQEGAEAAAAGTGKATVTLDWDLPREERVYGTFNVVTSYTVNERGHAVLGLDKHSIETKDEDPKDVSLLVGLLHNAMPPEMFDPSGCIQETTFVDGDVRVTKQHVGKYTGARHIFVRDPSILSSE